MQVWERRYVVYKYDLFGVPVDVEFLDKNLLTDKVAGNSLSRALQVPIL